MVPNLTHQLFYITIFSFWCSWFVFSFRLAETNRNGGGYVLWGLENMRKHLSFSLTGPTTFLICFRHAFSPSEGDWLLRAWLLFFCKTFLFLHMFCQYVSGCGCHLFYLALDRTFFQLRKMFFNDVFDVLF